MVTFRNKEIENTVWPQASMEKAQSPLHGYHEGAIELQARGVNFRSLTDSIDTSTPAGRFFFHVMSALAEMERELIVERTRAGLAAAREQGRIGGRRRIMTPEVVEHSRRMLRKGATRQQVASVVGVGVKTIYKYLPVG